MAYHAANVRNKYNIPKGPRVPLRGEDVYTAGKAAELLGACRSTVIRWLEAGLLRGSQLTSGAPWRIVVIKEDIERLKPNDVGDGWLPLKGAAAALGVSRQTVLQKVKSGELEAIRVRTGRRVGWRIRLSISIYDDQPALF